MDIKDGRPLDALFDIGLWYLLLIGIVLFAFGGKLGAGAVGIGKIMAIIGAVGILLTGGRKKKGIFGKLTGGLGTFTASQAICLMCFPIPDCWRWGLQQALLHRYSTHWALWQAAASRVLSC